MDIDYRLPHNKQIEQHVLGSILLNCEIIDEVKNEIEVDDFFIPDHKVIYNAMLELRDKKYPIDVSILWDHLFKTHNLLENNDETYLYELANNTPTFMYAKYYALIVRERSVLRKLIERSDYIASKAKEAVTDDDIKRAVEDAYRMIKEIDINKTSIH